MARIKLSQIETYTHNQASAASTWVINHGLNKHPSITVVDSSGKIVEGEEQYTDLNTITLTFSSAFTGKAYLN